MPAQRRGREGAEDRQAVPNGNNLPLAILPVGSAWSVALLNKERGLEGRLSSPLMPGRRNPRYRPSVFIETALPLPPAASRQQGA